MSESAEVSDASGRQRATWLAAGHSPTASALSKDTNGFTSPTSIPAQDSTAGCKQTSFSTKAGEQKACATLGDSPLHRLCNHFAPFSTAVNAHFSFNHLTGV